MTIVLYSINTIRLFFKLLKTIKNTIRYPLKCGRMFSDTTFFIPKETSERGNSVQFSLGSCVQQVAPLCIKRKDKSSEKKTLENIGKTGN